MKRGISLTRIVLPAMATALLSILLVGQTAQAESTSSNVLEEIIVTAQRTSESIQEVPIAVTALTGDMLQDQQVITVSDLQMNAPNVSFTNTNFGSNSLSIRGIGRLLTAATGDAGVSVHTNEIAIAPNLNTAEFYDMERVEILRGPQGTLYGKNATGGVVNFVTRKPDFDSVNGFLDIEAGDYNNRRIKAALNIPIGDNFAVRFAGMMLERDGYTENKAAGQVGTDGRTLDRDIFGNKLESEVDGRDQTDYRITASWNINDNASLWVLYNEHDEDSNRARISNQICVTGSLPTYGCEADGVGFQQPYNTSKVSATLASLLGLLPVTPDGTGNFNWERPSLDLRSMHTDFEPRFENNVKQVLFGFDYEFDSYTIGIVGGRWESEYLTQQDYNMDVSFELPPNFYRADGGWPIAVAVDNAELGNPNNPCNIYQGLAGVVPGGPCQISGLTQNYSYDQAGSEGEGWSYEVKLQSTYDGPFNFLVGYTQFDSESKGDYYVIDNILDNGRPTHYPGFFNNFSDYRGGTFLEGSSFFGEVYYDINEDIKLTLGLRQNDDDKAVSSTSVLWNAIDVNFPGSTAAGGNALPKLFSRVSTFLAGGAPTAAELDLINLYAPDSDLDAALATGPQSAERLAIHSAVPLVADFNETRVLSGSPSEFDWQETTGRIGIDWQINENSMLYAFFTRGYKPGGANPAIPREFQGSSAFDFAQEDIDAFEIGLKNTLMDGAMILNANIFTYDYTGLQVARIKNNTSLNENIDAKITGAELEMLWNVTEQFQLDFNYSWLDTEVDGSESVDPTNRTAGLDDDWIVLNGFAVLYIAPRQAIEAATPALLSAGVAAGAVLNAPASLYPNGTPSMVSQAFLDALMIPYQEGVPTSLDGNQLPNAPEHTLKVGMAYTWPMELLRGDVTLRWDYYWQDDTYAREFNTVGDEIDSWDQHNLALMYNSTNGKWNARAWVRNVQDEDNVTGHYLTADTSGYFRNWFLTEPRIYGLTVRYNFGAE